MKLDELAGLVDRLPEKPGVQGDGYRTSVVLLLLIPEDGEYKILFEKRAISIRQGGEISLPGGMHDRGDASLEATAIRETTEEVGIPPERIKIVGKLDSVFAPMGTLVNVFVAVAEVDRSEIVINREEVEKAFLLPVSFFESNDPEVYTLMTEVHPSYKDEATGEEVVLFPARDLGLPRRYWGSWGGFKHKVYVYRTEEGTIWGLTGRILVDFVRKVKSKSQGAS